MLKYFTTFKEINEKMKLGIVGFCPDFISPCKFT